MEVSKLTKSRCGGLDFFGLIFSLKVIPVEKLTGGGISQFTDTDKMENVLSVPINGPN